jgi:hypothetical protein
MIEWFKLSDARKKDILKEVSSRTNIPEQAIEKDLWVTLTLNAIYT